MPEVAYELAVLRASRVTSLPAATTEAARDVAAALGRRLVDVGERKGTRRFVLGWQDGRAPDPGEDVFSVRRLTQVPLVTLAICLGLCWLDVDHPPYPGAQVPLDDVESAGAELGVDRTHLIAALRHDLSLAGLVVLDGRTVELGPAIAAWTPAQIDALRRFAEVLPRPVDL